MNWKKMSRDIGSALFGSKEYGLHPKRWTGDVYPIELEFTLEDEDAYYRPRDGAGIPVRKYSQAGLQYSPTRIAAYALAHYNRLVTQGSLDSRSTFLQMADWFLREQDALWRYDFDWGSLKGPWISAMAQGEAISVLTRAYRLTGDERYLKQAIRAVAPLTLPIDQGGVRSRIDGFLDFVEEYPTTPPQHTLNGFLYTLIGLLDLSAIEPSIEGQVGLSSLIHTLETKWKSWDLGYWSSYDLHVTKSGRRNAATVSYHSLHVAQVGYLAERVDSAPLRACHTRWAGFAQSPANRVRALATKILYRLEEPPLS